MKFIDRFRDRKVYSFFDSDLDGVGSRIIYHYYIESITSCSFITNSAKRDMSEFNYDYCNKSDIILFVDIAPTVELYKELIELNKEVIICDHHQTSYIELQELQISESNYIYSTEDCGCMILFKQCTHGRRVQKCSFQFTELVNTYDTWQQNSFLWKDAYKLHNILWEGVNWFTEQSDTERYNAFIERQLIKFNKGKSFYFTEYENSLNEKALAKEKTNLNQARKTLSIRKDNSYNTYGYFECNSKLSIIATTLLKEYDNLDYICGYSTYLTNVKGEQSFKVSLRSREGFDVSIIAQKYGGGGHVNASGVDLPEEVFLKLQKGIDHLV